MKSLRRLVLAIPLLAALAFGGRVAASVVITGTRVIFPGDQSEVTVAVENNGATPALVQVWLDDGRPDAAPEDIDVPFTLAPAMFRLDPGKGQSLRLVNLQPPAAQDRESLYWLNLLEIPPKADAASRENYLQLAFRTRIKVIYRPVGLAGAPTDAPRAVTWRLSPSSEGGYELLATNPTPYYVNYARIALRANGKAYEAGGGHVAPMSSHAFRLASPRAVSGVQFFVDYAALNDYGGVVSGQHPAVLSAPYRAPPASLP